MLKPIRKKGFTLEAILEVLLPRRRRFAVLRRKDSYIHIESYIVEQYNHDGTLSKRQPTELWSSYWDSKEEALDAIRRYLDK